jgi:O-antigen/teichoic acid export membrane protein
MNAPGRPALLPVGSLWGALDQAVSSLTNFALLAIVGRSLGAASLGIVTVGFSSYVLILVLHRSLVCEPLVAAVPARSRDEQLAARRSAVTTTLAEGLVGGLVLLLLGAFLPTPYARGFLLFAPWILPSLLQDLWRYSLFHERRGSQTVLNDGLWLVGLVISLPLLFLLSRQEATAVAAWGLGATAGAAVGFLQSRKALPGHPREALRRFRLEWWPLGRWLGLDRIARNTASQGAVFLLAATVQAQEVGGFRAVQSLFMPLSLIAPALALPGLPAVARAWESSPALARSTALRLSGVVVTITLGYMAAMAMLGRLALRLVFGSAFVRFSSLLLPFAIGQVFAAAAVGFVVYLKVAKRGRVLLLSTVLGGVTSLALVVLLSGHLGAAGAAWGLAAGAGLSTSLLVGMGSARGSQVTEATIGRSEAASADG